MIISRAKLVDHAQLSKSSFSLHVHSFGVRLAGGSNCVFSSDAIYLANIFQGRIEYELIYSLRGAKHRVDYSVHIR